MTKVRPLNDDDFDELDKKSRRDVKQAFHATGIVGLRHSGATLDMARLMIKAGMGSAEDLFKGRTSDGRFCVSEEGDRLIKSWQDSKNINADGDIGIRSADKMARELGHEALLGRAHSAEGVNKSSNGHRTSDQAVASIRKNQQDGFKSSDDAVRAVRREMALG